MMKHINPRSVRDARRKVEAAVTEIRPHLLGLDQAHISAVLATMMADLLTPLPPTKRAEVIGIMMGLAAALLAEGDGNHERQKTIQ